MKVGPLLLTVLVFAAACSGGGEKTETPTAPAGASPTGVAETPAVTPAQPTPASPFDARDLRRTDPVPFPAGIVMYAIDAVWEGPTAALRRYYRDASGQFRTDTLVLSTFGQGRATDRAVVGVVFGPPGEVGVALCHGSCYGSPEPVTIARSWDGGVTWKDVFDVEAGSWGTLVAVDGDTTIIRGGTAGDWWTFQSVTPAGRTAISLPPGVPPTADSLGAFAASNTRVAVFSEGRRTIWDVIAGKPIATIPAAWDTRGLVALMTSRAGAEQIEVQLFGPAAGERTGYLAFLEPETSAARDVYRWREADGLGGGWITGWLSPTLGIGRADFDQADYLPGTTAFFHGIPALFDLEKGTVSPIAEFLPQLAGKAGGPVPVAVVPGAFARVNTGSDCLNVREFPSLSAVVLGCYADGVLLAEGGAEPSGDWRPVHTPDGREGWATAEFLEQ